VAERYLLDTDIVIEYLRGAAKAVQFLETLEGDLLLSVITVAELWAGARGEEEEAALEQFFLAFRILPVDEATAREGGILRRQYAPSHGIGLGDALIAGASLKEGVRLVSFNAKHFPMIEAIEVPYRSP
jgi:hypothetical protein